MRPASHFRLKKCHKPVDNAAPRRECVSKNSDEKIRSGPYPPQLIKIKKPTQMSSQEYNENNLVLVRELYDGMTLVIAAQSGVSEFLEYVLSDLAPDGQERVRVAVRRAHSKLGLTQ